MENSFAVTGFVGKDASIHQFTTASVARFSLAISRNEKNGDENTSEDVVAESFVDYWWNTDRACRRCSECGKLMREGYCADMGVAYYCSKDCLHSDFTDEEWAEECESNDQSYYTEW